jgi:SAM-dependent methyltransferase
MLLEEKEQTLGITYPSLNAAKEKTGAPLYLETLGLSDSEKRGIQRDYMPGGRVDAVVSYLVGSTSGWGYVDVIGKLDGYPIPNIPVDHGHGRLLLDVGCGWGRWTVSAANKGWRAVGLDPSLGAVMAGKRAFSHNASVSFICGDARFLPFKPGAFDAVFSYSVLQHFSKTDAVAALSEIARILSCKRGMSKIQMAHARGLRSTYVRTRRNYLDGGSFRVRYWSLRELRHVFEREIGPSQLRSEAFGGLGLLWEDWSVVSTKARFLLALSELMKRVSRIFPSLIQIADSVYVVSTKQWTA